MSAEILKPNELTYWIITNNNSYADGVTGPNQVTTVGNGWSLYYIGTDYNEYIAKCGEVMITPRLNAENEPVLPKLRISATQIRLWLISQGLTLLDIDNYISSIEDTLLREQTRTVWEYETSFDTNNSIIQNLLVGLGISLDIDYIFNEAIKL